MQINMPTHAHGQGYTDLNFLIPELVSGVQYKKGPYFVEDGDFTTAGSANIDYANVLEKPEAIVQGGSDQYLRGLLTGSPESGRGQPALRPRGRFQQRPLGRSGRLQEVQRGPPLQRRRRAERFLDSREWDTRRAGTRRTRCRCARSTTVEIDRFGTVDPTDGGETHRYSLSAEYQHSGVESVTRAVAYGIAYKLNLFSNFTYYLDDPVHGDQFEQADDRTAYGVKATHQWFARWGGLDVENEVGFQGRFDDIHDIGLYHTEDRERLSTTREDKVRQGSAALFFQNDTQGGATRSARSSVCAATCITST